MAYCHPVLIKRLKIKTLIFKDVAFTLNRLDKVTGLNEAFTVFDVNEKALKIILLSWKICLN